MVDEGFGGEDCGRDCEFVTKMLMVVLEPPEGLIAAVLAVSLRGTWHLVRTY